MELLLQLVISGILLGGIYALISMGLNLIFGVTGVINFAHGDFLMIGMYITFWLFTIVGFDPYTSIPIVFIASFALGYLTHKVVIKPVLGGSDINTLLVTAGLGIMFQNIALMLFKSDYRVIQTSYNSSNVQVFDALVSMSRLGSFAIVVIVAAAMFYLLMKTRLGADIRAVSQDSDAAILMGINKERIFAVTFGLGVGLVGIAACIITPIFYIFPTVGDSFSIIAFIVVILGGLGSFSGALIGGIIIGIVESIGGAYTSAELSRVFSLLIFLLVLFVKPYGIMGKNSRV